MSTVETPKFDAAFVAELARGAALTFENAIALCEEAKRLADAGARPRALALHQISLEECAKIDLLGPWAASLMSGLEVDDKKLIAAFSNHGAKNRTNAYMLPHSEEEAAAMARGDWKGAMAAFKAQQKSFHEDSNKAKNAALYVDFVDGSFISPAEQITAEMLNETASRNDNFLSLVAPKVRMMQKWAKAPVEQQQTVLAFMALAEEMKDASPKDARAAIEKLIGEFVARERKRMAQRNAREQTALGEDVHENS